jgi:hypothetical protein
MAAVRLFLFVDGNGDKVRDKNGEAKYREESYYVFSFLMAFLSTS